MAITFIPTRVDGSLGRVKNNAGPVTNLSVQWQASEFNTAMDYLAELAPVVGLSDGSTPGSVIAIQDDHEVRIDALEAAVASPLRYQGIVVGNSLAGDTANDVNVLDPGNGTGIASALSAASATGSDVWIRPGTYTLTGTLTVPANIRVRSSGKGTSIVTSSTVRNAVVISAGATWEDLNVTVSVPTGSPTGTTVVSVGSGASLLRPTVTFPSYSGGQIAIETIRSAISLGSGSTVSCPVVTMPVSFASFGAITTNTLTAISSTSTTTDSFVTNCIVTGADIGISSAGPSQITAPILTSIRYVGISLTTAAIAVGNGATKITSGKCMVSGANSLAGCLVTPGTDPSGPFGVCINNLFLYQTGGVSTRGVYLNGAQNATVIANCHFNGWTTGIQVTSSAVNCSAMNNYFTSTGTPVVDASPSFDDIHNKVI